LQWRTQTKKCWGSESITQSIFPPYVRRC
jgi:hypothetical protein